MEKFKTLQFKAKLLDGEEILGDVQTWNEMYKGQITEEAFLRGLGEQIEVVKNLKRLNYVSLVQGEQEIILNIDQVKYITVIVKR